MGFPRTVGSLSRIVLWLETRRGPTSFMPCDFPTQPPWVRVRRKSPRAACHAIAWALECVQKSRHPVILRRPAPLAVIPSLHSGQALSAHAFAGRRTCPERREGTCICSSACNTKYRFFAPRSKPSGAQNDERALRCRLAASAGRSTAIPAVRMGRMPMLRRRPAPFAPSSLRSIQGRL